MSKPQKSLSRRSLLALSSAFTLAPKGTLMAQQTDSKYYYNLTFRSVGCFYTARFNGVTVSHRPAIGRHEFALPINPHLVTGENVFEYIFVPAWGEEWPVGQPNPEFAVVANLEQFDRRTGETRDFGIVSAAFDMATGQVVPREMTSLGPAKGLGTADFGRLSQMEITKGVYTDIHGPPLEARILTVRFNIPSSFPPEPWSGAPVLEDTVALRSELAAAYEQVHRAIAASDLEMTRRLFTPAWTHLAAAMGYDSLESLLVALKPETVFVPQPEGESQGPLLFWPSLQDVRLELMAGGRLVRFDPAPIYWTRPDDPSNRTSSSHIAFYRGPDGSLKIGSVLLMV